jgi:hypothetical protein
MARLHLGRLLPVEAFQCGQNLPGNMLQTRPQFKDLFPSLTSEHEDCPACRQVMVRAVRVPPDQRRGIISNRP